MDSVIPAGEAAVRPAPGPAARSAGTDAAGAARLGGGARPGDKGGDANLGVFARTDEAWAWLDSFLTIERLRGLLPELAELRRRPLPPSGAPLLNFVVHGLLEEGVAASTRQDRQAKSLGEWLRARVVEMPQMLLFVTTTQADGGRGGNRGLERVERNPRPGPAAAARWRGRAAAHPTPARHPRRAQSFAVEAGLGPKTMALSRGRG